MVIWHSSAFILFRRSAGGLPRDGGWSIDTLVRLLHLAAVLWWSHFMLRPVVTLVALALLCLGGASQAACDSAARDSISAQEKAPEVVFATPAGEAFVSAAFWQPKPVRPSSTVIALPRPGWQEARVSACRRTDAGVPFPRLVGVVELRL